jgi:hypothetical protein
MKYRLARWDILNKPKNIGGWVLLAWTFKTSSCWVNGYLLANEEGVWQDTLKKKYFRNKTLSQMQEKKETHTFGQA